MIRTYADALFSIKRGFLIIGLTGYTASGCTAVANILARTKKPAFPGIEEVKDIIDEFRLKKLQHVWEELQWQKFTNIEIAKVIFLIAIYDSIRFNFKKGTQLKLAELSGPHKRIFSAAKYLIIPKVNLYRSDYAEKVVTAYEQARNLYGSFKSKTGLNLEQFIELMQNWGDEIRKFGRILSKSTAIKASPENILVLPEAVRRLIKAYRIARNNKLFVIDAFRNPFEVEFFKRRYNEFYLIGVQREQSTRRTSLLKNCSEQFIQKLERREKGKLIEKKNKNNVSEWITSQNVEECLQKSDYYILNKYDGTGTRPYLRLHIIKLLSLINKPGCITPTTDERNMQIAISARQNSGCLSRHVGAAVVSKDGYIIGVGWNDPPKGQVSCLFRSATDIINQKNTNFYSEYEKQPDFINHIEKENIGDNPFCFREEYAKIKGGKQAEYTRALHAEENAMLQAITHGFDALKGGTLYTTDCTCTLCAKKAYHLGISRIVFIEEYPGISIQQTIKTGQREIIVDQFQGVTGAAFFKLFSPLVNEKDFLKLYT